MTMKQPSSLRRALARAPLFALSVLLGVASSSAAVADAAGVPETILITARVQDGGEPASGAHGFAFRLYSQSTGGEPIWKEDDVTLAVQDGLLSRELGTVTPLAPVLTGGKLFLELVVDGITLQPRMMVTSAPYAMRAGTAARAERLGELAPSDVARVDTAGVVQGAHTAESWIATRTKGVISHDWTAIPGLTIPFELSRRANIIVQASGEQRAFGVGDATHYCHQGYRFVVDGAKLGHEVHGQRLEVSRSDISWWQMWSFSHVQTLEAGKHTITLETRDTGPTMPSQCAVCAETDGSTLGYTDCNMSVLATYL